MSGFEKARSISLACDAGQDLPQYRFVKTSATGIVLCGAGEDSVGVSLEMYDDSEVAAGNGSPVIPVAVLDGAKLMIEAGAAITAGAAIASGASGKAAAAASTARILGYALEAASADGEFIQFVAAKGGRFALT